ncbi:MAG: hypothetical protein M3P26_11805 [Gemmatimonadota bacterium]|nr:hypothetical protein [Gemmatimonadota bacterium]
MSDKPERQDFILLLPIDPKAADDPAIIEAFPNHMRLIGSIIAEWSHVEYKLAMLLAMGLRCPQQTVAAMLYAIESSGARLDVIEAVFRHFKEPARSEASALIEEARSMLVQRNKFAHSIYGESADGGLAIVGIRRDSAGDLPEHDLRHQFERMKALSYHAGRFLAILAGVFQEQPTGQSASDALRNILSDSTGVRIHPSPEGPPKPSPE